MNNQIEDIFKLPDTPRILFEDYYLAVIIKPYGYTVEKHHRHKSIEDFFLHHLENQFPDRKNHFIGIVNRIDVVTGGLVIIAKTPQALKQLNQQFAERKTEKIYLALVEGFPKNTNQKISGYVTEDKLSKTAKFTLQKSKTSKTASLTYRTLKSNEKNSLVEIQLETGRFHQIRATFQFLNHPIVNDVKYNAKKNNNSESIYLLANTIKFTHPKSNEKLTVEIQHIN